MQTINLQPPIPASTSRFILTSKFIPPFTPTSTSTSTSIPTSTSTIISRSIPTSTSIDVDTNVDVNVLPPPYEELSPPYEELSPPIVYLPSSYQDSIHGLPPPPYRKFSSIQYTLCILVLLILLLLFSVYMYITSTL